MAGTHHNFEELEVWKRASRLAVEVLKMIDGIKLYALRDQVARSCLSIPSNIAEGAERGTDKEFARFLSIAKGSAAELRTQFYVAIRAGLVEPSQGAILVQEAKEIGAMTEGLKKSLRGSGFMGLILSWFF
jgi:four helix bundle protein